MNRFRWWRRMRGGLWLSDGEGGWIRLINEWNMDLFEELEYEDWR